MTEQHFHFLVQNSLRIYFWDIFEGSNKTTFPPPKKKTEQKKKALKREWKSMSKKREKDKIFLQVVLLSTAVK